MFFCFKQKTAYEMRISDWSSDVCSSDLFHVALMHSRGYQYETQGHWILRFDRFLQANPELAGSSLETMLACWKAAKPTRNHAAECQKRGRLRSEEHTSELQPLMPNSYAVFCL